MTFFIFIGALAVIAYALALIEIKLGNSETPVPAKRRKEQKHVFRF
ncbi:hypothetical protein WG936_05330 [Corynebacterium sp. H127]